MLMGWWLVREVGFFEGGCCAGGGVPLSVMEVGGEGRGGGNGSGWGWELFCPGGGGGGRGVCMYVCMYMRIFL